MYSELATLARDPSACFACCTKVVAVNLQLQFLLGMQVVVMKVAIHCQGCAGKVRKHISKMEGA